MLDHFPSGNQIEHLENEQDEFQPVSPLEKLIAFLIGAFGLAILIKAYIFDGN